MDAMSILEPLQYLIDQKAEAFGAEWIRAFDPVVRPYDESLVLFARRDSMPIRSEVFNHVTPEVIPLYEGVYSRQNESLFLESFVKGAAALANYIDEDDHGDVGNLIMMVLEAATSETRLPAICDPLKTQYVELMVATLTQDLDLTCGPMLAYLGGVFWLAGHVSKGDQLINQLMSILRDRVRRGTFEEY